MSLTHITFDIINLNSCDDRSILHLCTAMLRSRVWLNSLKLDSEKNLNPSNTSDFVTVWRWSCQIWPCGFCTTSASWVIGSQVVSEPIHTLFTYDLFTMRLKLNSCVNRTLSVTLLFNVSFIHYAAESFGTLLQSIDLDQLNHWSLLPI